MLRFMRQLGFGALLALSVLTSAAGALAEPSDTGASSTPRAPVVLVLESSEGAGGANQLRAALSRQFGLKVLALGDAQHGADQPGALMAIATERGSAVRVMYVDALGRRDTLRAPAPARREEMASVVQALSAALLERHLRELEQPMPIDTRERSVSDERSKLSLPALSRSLYAALTRLGYPRHRSGDLHREDF
jgi:hypothetical protein